MSGAPDTAAATSASPSTTVGTLLREARRGSHWAQLSRFAAVGASGYVVNLAVYAFALDAGLEYRAAAAAAFAVAVVNNFAWNRLWTFRDARGHVGGQAFRFAVISCSAFVISLAALSVLVRDLGTPKLLAQAIAIAAVTPASFLANKLWSFRTARV
jgi:dolichol-phosphate mannosyltransferase